MRHRGSGVILYADDDANDRLLAAEAMRESGVANRLEMVEDGAQLLAYLRHEGPFADPGRSPRPSIILMDLNMPRMDGREALTHIMEDPDLARIPVVVLSTSRAATDVDRSYAAGARSYVAKPVTFDSLVQVMKDLARYWFEVVELPGTTYGQPSGGQ